MKTNSLLTLALTLSLAGCGNAPVDNRVNQDPAHAAHERSVLRTPSQGPLAPAVGDGGVAAPGHDGGGVIAPTKDGGGNNNNPPPDGGQAASPDMTPPQAPPPPAHSRCGWIYTDDPAIVDVFVAHAAWFDAIHPDWYAMNPDGVSVRTIAGVDDPKLVAAAHANHVLLWPMIASVENTAWLRTMMYDPAKRAAHIQGLVALAVAHGYDGLDLDYEHTWDPADAAPLKALAIEFGQAMHAVGKRASMAVPALDGASNVWDYATLAANLDEAHLMAYDFHTIGTHAGPTSPLGWIDAVGANIEKGGHPEKFVLGLPNYGVTPSSACTLATCAASCTSAIATATDHMKSCSYGNQAPGRILSCSSNSGDLFFDDTASLEEKVQSAKNHHLGGITYWNVGGEPAGFFPMVQKYY